MKKSELLQLAIDEHLAMTLDEYKCDTFSPKFKPKFLCLAARAACIETANEGMERELAELITTSIDGCLQYASFLMQTANIDTCDANYNPAKFAFIQFMRKKRAEHIIAQLQAIGE